MARKPKTYQRTGGQIGKVAGRAAGAKYGGSVGSHIGGKIGEKNKSGTNNTGFLHVTTSLSPVLT